MLWTLGLQAILSVFSTFIINREAIKQDISEIRIPMQKSKIPYELFMKNRLFTRSSRSMRISGIERRKKPDETGVFLATAHPAKFKETVEECIGSAIEIPDRLSAFMRRKKQSHLLSNDFNLFKNLIQCLLNFIFILLFQNN